MSRRFLTGITTMAAILLIAGVASAKSGMGGMNSGGGGPTTGLSGGIFIFDRDTPIPSSISTKAGVVGLGYEMTGKWGTSPHWGWDASFGYGIGDLKIETSSATASTSDELSLSHWEVRVGWDYWSDCCDQDWYCGPGFIYTSTSGTEKRTATADLDLDPVKVIGFEPRVGGQMKVGNNMKVFGQLSQLVGHQSYDQTIAGEEDKITGWVTSTAWRGGVRWMFR